MTNEYSSIKTHNFMDRRNFERVQAAARAMRHQDRAAAAAIAEGLERAATATPAPAPKSLLARLWAKRGVAA